MLDASRVRDSISQLIKKRHIIRIGEQAYTIAELEERARATLTARSGTVASSPNGDVAIPRSGQVARMEHGDVAETMVHPVAIVNNRDVANSVEEPSPLELTQSDPAQTEPLKTDSRQREVALFQELEIYATAAPRRRKFREPRTTTGVLIYCVASRSCRRYYRVPQVILPLA